MKKYDVAVTVSFETFYTVKADSEEDAKDKASELACIEFGGRLIDDVNPWSVTLCEEE